MRNCVTWILISESKCGDVGIYDARIFLYQQQCRSRIRAKYARHSISATNKTRSQQKRDRVRELGFKLVPCALLFFIFTRCMHVILVALAAMYTIHTETQSGIGGEMRLCVGSNARLPLYTELYFGLFQHDVSELK
jgi:hypothetical protein